MDNPLVILLVAVVAYAVVGYVVMRIAVQHGSREVVEAVDRLVAQQRSPGWMASGATVEEVEAALREVEDRDLTPTERRVASSLVKAARR